MNISLISYETICMLNSNLTEDLILEIIHQYNNMLIENGAENICLENKGIRYFKYTIKQEKSGIDIQLNYKANRDIVACIEKSMRINQSILRYMIYRIE